MGHRHALLEFVLRPIPPLRLDLTVWALRRRPCNLIDRWDGTTYRRVIVMGGRPTELATPLLEARQRTFFGGQQPTPAAGCCSASMDAPR